MKRRRTLKKEKIITLSLAVMALTALTITGVSVRNKTENKDNNYVVDLDEIEKVQSEANTEEKPLTSNEYVYMEHDLDADPSFQEANSGDIVIPGVTKQADNSAKDEDDEAKEPFTEDTEEADNTDTEEVKQTSSSGSAVSPNFMAEESLVWPVNGNVILPYSMDKSVYFPTLKQYRYNPSVFLNASVNDSVSAAADAQIVSIFEDARSGMTVVLDLGNGYEATYGQLTQIPLKEGDFIQAGETIGYVSEPTKYYLLEGTHVYFQLCKDDAPLNPLEFFE